MLQSLAREITDNDHNSTSPDLSAICSPESALFACFSEPGPSNVNNEEEGEETPSSNGVQKQFINLEQFQSWMAEESEKTQCFFRQARTKRCLPQGSVIKIYVCRDAYRPSESRRGQEATKIYCSAGIRAKVNPDGVVDLLAANFVHCHSNTPFHRFRKKPKPEDVTVDISDKSNGNPISETDTFLQSLLSLPDISRQVAGTAEDFDNENTVVMDEEEDLILDSSKVFEDLCTRTAIESVLNLQKEDKHQFFSGNNVFTNVDNFRNWLDEECKKHNSPFRYARSKRSVTTDIVTRAYICREAHKPSEAKKALCKEETCTAGAKVKIYPNGVVEVTYISFDHSHPVAAPAVVEDTTTSEKATADNIFAQLISSKESLDLINKIGGIIRNLNMSNGSDDETALDSSLLQSCLEQSLTTASEECKESPIIRQFDTIGEFQDWFTGECNKYKCKFGQVRSNPHRPTGSICKIFRCDHLLAGRLECPARVKVFIHPSGSVDLSEANFIHSHDLQEALSSTSSGSTISSNDMSNGEAAGEIRSSSSLESPDTEDGNLSIIDNNLSLLEQLKKFTNFSPSVNRMPDVASTATKMFSDYESFQQWMKSESEAKNCFFRLVRSNAHKTSGITRKFFECNLILRPTGTNQHRHIVPSCTAHIKIKIFQSGIVDVYSFNFDHSHEVSEEDLERAKRMSSRKKEEKPKYLETGETTLTLEEALNGVLASGSRDSVTVLDKLNEDFPPVVPQKTCLRTFDNEVFFHFPMKVMADLWSVMQTEKDWLTHEMDANKCHFYQARTKKSLTDGSVQKVYVCKQSYKPSEARRAQQWTRVTCTSGVKIKVLASGQVELLSASFVHSHPNQDVPLTRKRKSDAQPLVREPSPKHASTGGDEDSTSSFDINAIIKDLKSYEENANAHNLNNDRNCLIDDIDLSQIIGDEDNMDDNDLLDNLDPLQDLFPDDVKVHLPTIRRFDSLQEFQTWMQAESNRTNCHFRQSRSNSNKGTGVTRKTYGCNMVLTRSEAARCVSSTKTVTSCTANVKLRINASGAVDVYSADFNHSHEVNSSNIRIPYFHADKNKKEKESELFDSSLAQLVSHAKDVADSLDVNME